MVYDNCLKYIIEELNIDKNINFWKRKKVILFGLNSLSKTIFYILNTNEINNVYIVDLKTKNKLWSNVPVRNDFTYFTKDDEAEIIITEKSDLVLINDFIKKNEVDFSYMIKDLSYIRMNKMPNPIVPTEYTEIIGLRECQLLQLEVMDYLVDFCKANDIRVFLVYGSLIGAVRHHGFIPWDDDVDIAMPIPDYFKFCEIFPRDSEVFFDSMFNEMVQDLTPSTLTKIKSKKMVVEYNHFPLRTMTGIGVDIFPLSGYPDDEEEQMRYMEEFMVLSDKWKEYVVIPYGTQDYSKEIHKDLFDKMCKLSCRYDYEKSKYVGVAYFEKDKYPTKDGNRAMPKEWYANKIDVDFEGRKYPVPIGYDQILKKRYGDYMKLPPEYARIPSHSNDIFVVNSFDKYQ